MVLNVKQKEERLNKVNKNFTLENKEGYSN